MRMRARRDANERAIVDALEDIGCVIHRVSSPSLPDLLVYHRGRWLPVEVKMPKGKLTDGQIDTYRQSPFPIVTTVSEALRLFGVR